MEQLYYSLRIRSEEHQYKSISEILGKPLNDLSKGWILEVEPKEEYYDFINEFLDALEGHYDDLEKIGVKRSDISVWMIYGYQGQCNMEFAPDKMRRLGENGITLCISCYEVGE